MKILMYRLFRIALAAETFEKVSVSRMKLLNTWLLNTITWHKINIVTVATECCYGNETDSELPSTKAE